MLNDLMLLPEWHEVCKRYRYDITRFAVEALDMTEQAGQAVTWQQELLFESIQIPGSRTSVASGHGCFGIDTSIMLADGSVKPVQDITINDQLMGDDGKSSRNVLDLIRGRERMYRVIYDDGSSHVFNESHTLCLKHHGKFVELTVWEWLALDDDSYVCYRLVNGKYEELQIDYVVALGEGDYYGFVIDGNNKFLGGDFTVLHNTGKSRSAGIVALWHLLFYPESVMLFTAPQIGQLRTVVWKEINICLQRLRNNKLFCWLADYVVVLTEKIYIKGYKETWFVFAKTAPKHQPTNIAGQHGDYYMVWADEACGIDDAVMEVAIGALTHENNRAVLTSQPASNVGFFYDTHHTLSHKNGGKWIALAFNSEVSPLVSKDKLVEALFQYGSRDHAGYLIRIRGIFPELKGEYLLTRSEITALFLHQKTIGKIDKKGIVITVDVGGNVGRDSTVITVADVCDKLYKGRERRHVHILDIPLFSNRADINHIKAKIYDTLAEHQGATLVIDPLGAGMGLCQSLKAEGVYFDEVHWGVPCFNNTLKSYYANKRAHAYVGLAKAIENGLFTVSNKVKKHYQLKNNITEQATKLPYTFDEKGRWKMMSKEDMRKKGIPSPDILDTFAFFYLEGIHYVPTDSYYDNHTEQKDLEEWGELEEMGEAL